MIDAKTKAVDWFYIKANILFQIQKVGYSLIVQLRIESKKIFLINDSLS